MVPPLLILDDARPGGGPSRSSLDRGGVGSDVHALCGDISLLLLSLALLSRLVLSGSILADRLGLVALGDGFSRSSLLLLLTTLHGLAGLAEQTTQLLGLALTLSTILLDAKVAEEGSAALVLRSRLGSRSLSSILSGLTLSRSSGSLLSGLGLLHGVLKLRSSAGDRGGLLGGVLLSLLLSGAGDLLEEVAEERSTLGLLVGSSLGLLLLLLVLGSLSSGS